MISFFKKENIEKIALDMNYFYIGSVLFLCLQVRFLRKGRFSHVGAEQMKKRCWRA